MWVLYDDNWCFNELMVLGVQKVAGLHLYFLVEEAFWNALLFDSCDLILLYPFLFAWRHYILTEMRNAYTFQQFPLLFDPHFSFVSPFVGNRFQEKKPHVCIIEIALAVTLRRDLGWAFLGVRGTGWDRGILSLDTTFKG
jgi:hypothetical protein